MEGWLCWPALAVVGKGGVVVAGRWDGQSLSQCCWPQWRQGLGGRVLGGFLLTGEGSGVLMAFLMRSRVAEE